MSILIRTPKKVGDISKSFKLREEGDQEGIDQLRQQREDQEAKDKELEFRSNNYELDDPKKAEALSTDESRNIDSTDPESARRDDEDKYQYRDRLRQMANKKKALKEMPSPVAPPASRPKPKKKPEDEDVW